MILLRATPAGERIGRNERRSDQPAGPVTPRLGESFGWVIVELAPDAIFVVDDGVRVLVANGAAEAMFGYDREGPARLLAGRP